MLNDPVSKKIREAQRAKRAFETLETSGVTVSGEEFEALLDQLETEAEEELNLLFSELRK